MAQRNSRHPEMDRSQRPMRIAALLMAIILPFWSDAALAEVCDKVAGEHWRPNDGVWGLAALRVIELAAIVSLLGAAYLVKATWLAWAMAIFILLRALFAVALWMDDLKDGVYSAAVREGCRSLPLDQIHIGVLAVCVIAGIWLGFHLRGRHAEPA